MSDNRDKEEVQKTLRAHYGRKAGKSQAEVVLNKVLQSKSYKKQMYQAHHDALVFGEGSVDINEILDEIGVPRER